MTITQICLALGVVHGLAGALLAVAPSMARGAAQRFPRNPWAGRILAALAMAWSLILVREMPLGWFDAYKGWLWAVAPVSYLLIVLFLDELLASRALGGMLLLVANPILEAARFQGSAWRLAPVILAYVWVILGMALVLAPYRFRKWAGILCANDGRCRTLAVVFLAMGGLFLWLSVRGFGA